MAHIKMLFVMFTFEAFKSVCRDTFLFLFFFLVKFSLLVLLYIFSLITALMAYRVIVSVQVFKFPKNCFYLNAYEGK